MTGDVRFLDLGAVATFLRGMEDRGMDRGDVLYRGTVLGLCMEVVRKMYENLWALEYVKIKKFSFGPYSPILE